MEEELRRLKDELAASEQRVIEAEEKAAAAEVKAQENATMTQEIRMLQQENDMLLLQTNEPSQVMSAQNPTLRINWTNSLRYETRRREQRRGLRLLLSLVHKRTSKKRATRVRRTPGIVSLALQDSLGKPRNYIGCSLSDCLFGM